jgi:hypothetical protein
MRYRIDVSQQAISSFAIESAVTVAGGATPVGGTVILGDQYSTFRIDTLRMGYTAVDATGTPARSVDLWITASNAGAPAGQQIMDTISVADNSTNATLVAWGSSPQADNTTDINITSPLVLMPGQELRLAVTGGVATFDDTATFYILGHVSGFVEIENKGQSYYVSEGGSVVLSNAEHIYLTYRIAAVPTALATYSIVDPARRSVTYSITEV